jgi:hypothetical protein
MLDEEQHDGWDEWKNHVLSELKDNKEDLKFIMSKMTKIGNDIATLQVKSGVWGLVGGMIPVLIVLALWAIRSQGGS